MEIDSIDETDELTDTSAQGESNYVEGTIQSEFQPPPTETLSLQEPVDRSSELVIHGPNAIVSDDSIQSSCSQKNGKFDKKSSLLYFMLDFVSLIRCL